MDGEEEEERVCWFYGRKGRWFGGRRERFFEGVSCVCACVCKPRRQRHPQRRRRMTHFPARKNGMTERIAPLRLTLPGAPTTPTLIPPTPLLAPTTQILSHPLSHALVSPVLLLLVPSPTHTHAHTTTHFSHFPLTHALLHTTVR